MIPDSTPPSQTGIIAGGGGSLFSNAKTGKFFLSFSHISSNNLWWFLSTAVTSTLGHVRF